MAAVLVAASTACATGGGSQLPCDTTADCGAGEACVDQRCVTRAGADAGSRDAGASSIRDAGRDASGPGTDAGMTLADAGYDAGHDAGYDAGFDAGPVCGDSLCAAGELVSCIRDCDLVPTMTGFSAPSGTVTSSGDFSGSYPAWHAFDSPVVGMGADIAQIWLSEQSLAPAWVAYEFAGSPRTVLQYGISYNNGGLTTRAPSAWQLQARSGASWVTLDSQSGQSGWTHGEWRTFSVASPAAYQAYRLLISDDNDSREAIVTASVGELALFGY